MTPEAKIYTERIDDIPLLVCQQKKMGIPDVLDRIIQPHGNRQGLSVGWMTTGWLSYIVSEGDHRMVEVEGWIKDHQASLSHLIPQPVRVKDFTDDRLADVLGEFSQDAVWDEIESQLGQHLIRVYDLNVDRIRLDSTSVSVYHDGEEQTLFRPGHSKDHRPDLAQFKVMLGTLDPLGLPLATLVVPGNCADDPLYLPCFKRAQKVVGQGGRLYIGDAKMGALETRTFIQAGDDYYLSPLSQVGNVGEVLHELLVPVFEGRQDLQRIDAEPMVPQDEANEAEIEGDADPLSLGFEVVRQQQAVLDDEALTWQERVLVIYSPQLARKGHQGLDRRIERAEKACFY
jgi:transposase